MSAAGADNINNRDSDYIIFIMKDTKSYVPVITLSAKENKKLWKLFSKGFERSVYWMNIKQKVMIKIRQINLDIVLNQILLAAINHLF